MPTATTPWPSLGLTSRTRLRKSRKSLVWTFHLKSKCKPKLHRVLFIYSYGPSGPFAIKLKWWLTACLSLYHKCVRLLLRLSSVIMPTHWGSPSLTLLIINYRHQFSYLFTQLMQTQSLSHLVTCHCTDFKPWVVLDWGQLHLLVLLQLTAYGGVRTMNQERQRGSSTCTMDRARAG